MQTPLNLKYLVLRDKDETLNFNIHQGFSGFYPDIPTPEMKKYRTPCFANVSAYFLIKSEKK
jgi:hypothetical protein